MSTSGDMAALLKGDNNSTIDGIPSETANNDLDYQEELSIQGTTYVFNRVGDMDRNDPPCTVTLSCRDSGIKLVYTPKHKIF